MTDLEHRIAQVAEELRKLEADMRRCGLAVTPEAARVRRWELGRCVASLYQRWQEFVALHQGSSGQAYRHVGRTLAHAPRPD